MARPGVALQMFSLRDMADADYVGALREAAGAGYQAVETAFGYGGLDAPALRRVLDELGLQIAASHVGSDRLRSGLEEEIDLNLSVGNPHLVCAELPPEDRRGEESFHRWAADLGSMGRRCRELGADMSYHSHSFEFRRFGNRTGLDILLGEAEGLLWEPDVYWITFAGEDPAAWIGRYADRCRLVHLKDMKPAPLPADPIEVNAGDLAAYLSVALGQGRLDFAPAIAAARSAEWLIVEQDFSDGPMGDAIRQSRGYLRGTGF